MKIFKIILILFCSSIFFSPLLKAETNKSSIRSNLEKGWEVVYGNEIDHEDYIEFGAVTTAAAACVVATEGVGVAACYTGLEEYFRHRLESTAERISDELARRSRNEININKWVLLEKLIRSIIDQTSFQFPQVDLDGGLLTYNHWRFISYGEPRTYECKQSLPFGGWTWSICSTTEQVKKKIPLLNTFQPYVRYRIRYAGNKNSSPFPNGNHRPNQQAYNNFRKWVDYLNASINNYNSYIDYLYKWKKDTYALHYDWYIQEFNKQHDWYYDGLKDGAEVEYMNAIYIETVEKIKAMYQKAITDSDNEIESSTRKAQIILIQATRNYNNAVVQLGFTQKIYDLKF
jgi:hypothetical protein